MTDGSRSPERPTDVELVQMLAAGHPNAFAELADQYGAHLQSVAEGILQDREDALDTVQEALLKAYQEVASLRNAARLGAWLTSILRNHVLNKLRRRRHRPLVLQMGEGSSVLEITGALAEAAVGPPRQLEIQELREEVRRGPAELSGVYAETIEMFYLRGMQVSAIAEHLGVPPGTVKWRLSQARAMLRKELIMSDVTDALRNEAEIPPLLEVKNVWGNTGSTAELRPWEVCKTLLAQQVLFAVHKELKNPAQIARDVKASVDYVQDHLARMTKAEVLEEIDGRYRANCILFDDGDVQQLRKQLGERGERVAEVIGKHDGELSDVIGQTSPCQQDFDLGYLRWIVLPTMVLNFGIDRRLHEQKHVEVTPPARPDGGRWFFWPALLDAKLPSEFGCNATLRANGHAQYWNDLHAVPITRISGEQSFLLHRLAKGPAKRQSLLDVFSEQTVAGMIEKGLARSEGETVTAAVPIFHPQDGDSLQLVVSKVVNAIVDEAYDDYPEGIYAMLDRLGFAFARQDYPARSQTLAQMGAVPALIKRGTLPEPPSPVPGGWGFFAWTGVFSPMEMKL